MVLGSLSQAFDVMSLEVARLSGKNNSLEFLGIADTDGDKFDAPTLKRYRDWLLNETNPRWARLMRKSENAFLTGSQDYLADVSKTFKRKTSLLRVPTQEDSRSRVT